MSTNHELPTPPMPPHLRTAVPVQPEAIEELSRKVGRLTDKLMTNRAILITILVWHGIMLLGIWGVVQSIKHAPSIRF